MEKDEVKYQECPKGHKIYMDIDIEDQEYCMCGEKYEKK